VSTFGARNSNKKADDVGFDFIRAKVFGFEGPKLWQEPFAVVYGFFKALEMVWWPRRREFVAFTR
jgi:hypothetical protein